MEPTQNLNDRAKMLRIEAATISSMGGGGADELLTQATALEKKTTGVNTKFMPKKNNRDSSRDNKDIGIYSNSLITRSISLPITSIGKNIQETIEKSVAATFEGKCAVEGFIQPGSTRILTYSSGMVYSTFIKFEVVFECRICCPVEGLNIECIVKNITKAGIRAESSTETPSPIVVFITRDHHYTSPYFLSVEENSKIMIRVIGQRFELNDKYISIIAELIEPRLKKERVAPRLVMDSD
jgi:DNA-directed RNA polymerase subunit E'/Rpb7